MRLITTPQSRAGLSSAPRLITEALDILDGLDAPGQIGSMLDLAAARLEKFLDQDDLAATGVQALMSQLERELDCERDAARASDGCTPSPWDIPPA